MLRLTRALSGVVVGLALITLLIGAQGAIAVPAQGEEECEDCETLACTPTACCLINEEEDCICDCEPIDP